MTRSASGRQRLEGLGARAVEADVFDAASLRRAFAEADAVVNLLTHIPSADRMADPSAWAENDHVRTEASAAIARAAQAAGVRRLVQESIAFVYADGGDAWLDEDAPGAYRPTLWLDDAAAAVAASLRVPAGTYNVADADPPTNAEIDAALAAAVGVDALRTRPPQDGPLARSQRVSSRRLREAGGWAPRLRAGTEIWDRIAA